ncbi:PilZ domain-containing protein [Roseateles saccharophilus]|uniref:PilZ domain-containing protein n=1 Tax=Roseateles saccharophilus TaxID=304 RepID=UPI00104E28C1|nr:PilZ domain-containing protein [Roseateles saccharophilus]MDG0831724.1 PilZ domain-containing protein [Roseateles saccharophilus]
MSTERRQFARVAFASGAELITTQAHLRCQVIDISLKGVLLQLPAGHVPLAGMPCLVKLPLGDGGGDLVIAMAGELAHVEGAHAGVQCRSIDLESITHLRRLIEMNLGDPSASERELKALIAAAGSA